MYSFSLSVGNGVSAIVRISSFFWLGPYWEDYYWYCCYWYCNCCYCYYFNQSTFFLSPNGFYIVYTVQPCIFNSSTVILSYSSTVKHLRI